MGMGLETLCQEDGGMLQTSGKAIFSRIIELTQEVIDNGNALNFEIDVQFLQIYDNSVYDLLKLIKALTYLFMSSSL